MTELSPRLLALLRGDASPAWESLQRSRRSWLFLCTACMIAGSAIYGATVGIWRSPLQAFYTACKLPLLILFTCLANAMLNGITAQLLGLKVRFEESALLIVTSFAVMAIILAAFSPITFFLATNAPPYETPAGKLSHSSMLVLHVGLIAYAGVMANHRLFQLLVVLGRSTSLARTVLVSWLAANLFLGAQISWILRPFVGSPGLPVAFLRENPMRGNFYEAVAHALQVLFNASTK